MVLLVALWAVLWAAGGCAPSGRPVTPGPDSFWLASTGFDDRADWPSTVVHLPPDEVRGAMRLTFLLDDVESLVLLPAWSEGWGVHLAGPDGEAACELDVWLNGVQQLRDRRGPSVGVDGVVYARQLSALEVHRGTEGPVQDPEGCGALLLWSGELAAPWEAPFRGRLAGVIRGDLADTVAVVHVADDGPRIRPDAQGRWVLGDLRPGLHEVVFETPEGTLLRRWARIFAHAETRVDLEVGLALRR